jgi:hypothetical protein
MLPSSNSGVWATVQWLMAHQLPALPVAPFQDPYQYPRMVAAKPERGIFSHVDCQWQDGKLCPKPLFTGKNPSYLDGQGIPHLVYHHRYQKTLPSERDLRQWFANPNNGVGSLGGHQRSPGLMLMRNALSHPRRAIARLPSGSTSIRNSSKPSPNAPTAAVGALPSSCKHRRPSPILLWNPVVPMSVKCWARTLHGSGSHRWPQRQCLCVDSAS